MKYEIMPFRGLRMVFFGMSFHEVRKAMNANFKSFKRTPDSAFPCDHFPDLGMFAYYNEKGVLEAIELARPAMPMLDNKNLLGMNFDAAIEFLKSKGSAPSLDNDGATVNSLGISIYAPQAVKNPSAPCESVLIFSKGYYD